MLNYTAKPATPIVFYDGHCGLCSRTVSFLLKADKNKQLFFAPQQGETFQHLLNENQLLVQENSVVLLKNGVAYYRSDAMLEIMSLLPLPWKFLAILKIIPAGIRDLVYNLIARNRNRFWGLRNICYRATGIYADRMLP
jgi:predicted DCC family thiol-disulfide oxidoreductase YuxK